MSDFMCSKCQRPAKCGLRRKDGSGIVCHDCSANEWFAAQLGENFTQQAAPADPYEPHRDVVQNAFWLGNHGGDDADKAARYWQIAGTPPDPRFLRAENQGVDGPPSLTDFTNAEFDALVAAEVQKAVAETEEWYKSWSSAKLVLHDRPLYATAPAPVTSNSPPADKPATHPTAHIRIVEDRETRLGCQQWAADVE